MTTTCYTPSYMPLPFYRTSNDLEPKPRFSRSGKKVISAFFASSFVRNDIFCLHFPTNEQTADRQITSFREGLARSNPNTIECKVLGALEMRRAKLKAVKLRNCESLLDAVIYKSGFSHSRLPAAMTLKNTVVNAIVRRRGGPTRTKGMKTELRCATPIHPKCSCSR